MSTIHVKTVIKTCTSRNIKDKVTPPVTLWLQREHNLTKEKVKITLSLCLITHHTIKARGEGGRVGVDVHLHVT
jgi:hypothetical protein